MKADTSMKKKKERTDKKLNRKKVLVALAKNPQATQREISQETKMSIGAVNSHIEEVEKSEHIKDERVEKVLRKDKEIVELAQEIITHDLRSEKKRIENEEERKLNALSVNQLAKDSTARYSLFKWEVTDKSWWLKDMSQVWTKELEERIKHLLNL